MSAAKRKPQSNGDIRKRKGDKKQEDVDDDDALLDAGGGSIVDSFVVLRFSVWVTESILSLAQRRRKEKSGDAEGKSDAAKKKDKSDEIDLKEQVREAVKMKNYGIPIGLTILTVLTCLLMILGEGFGEGDDNTSTKIDEDYYGTLGIARDADSGDVKRAYKTLARRWHPDKNPNCTVCAETFSKIGVAYETLSDERKRKTYDESGGIATDLLKSARSVPLTQENFDQMVTYSNDVWIVQIFKPQDGHCASFHAFWEEQIQKNGHLVRFGRVDVTTDPASWLPVKYRVLPTVLKFGRHLGSPEIYPITSMHETAVAFNNFVITSFPKIGLPLDKDAPGLLRWVKSSGRIHKVLLALPGESKEERYKSHLVARKLANQWSELFEFRTAETSQLYKMKEDNLPSEIRNSLPPENESKHKAAMILFAAAGDGKPKETAIINWPAKEDDMVLHLLQFAERGAIPLSTRSADLVCRSLKWRRVYCLVLLDSTDGDMKTATEELHASHKTHLQEVEEIRAEGQSVTDEEESFIVQAVRLFRRPRGIQPATSTCRAPKFPDVEKVLGGSPAFLMDLDTGRIAPLGRGGNRTTSYTEVYQQITYEDTLTWTDDVLHPFLSLPDCDEGLFPHFIRSLRSASILELVVQIVTAIFLLEAIAKTFTLESMKQKLLWGAGAGVLLLFMSLRSPLLLRRVSGYMPGFFFSPSLLA
jgi:hypothetical protein|mmetsp:Transcript_10254/g.16737  ORF Transcript_10254/g.16737 Transcript_10254/m.16737 type:complete len:702 (+) Transcript_10254:60-2165(+)